MERDSGGATAFVSKLLVRTTLTYLNEAEFPQNCHDLGWLEDRDITHTSRDRNVLNTDKLRFEHGFAVLQEHRNYFAKIGIQFVKRCTLRMRAWKSWDKANKQPGVWVAFNHCGIGSHKTSPVRRKLSSSKLTSANE